jgi:GMP synthase-like glutamine amidotransferase
VKILFVKHVEREGPGLFEGLALEGGHRVETLSPFRSEPLPEPGGLDAIVSLGGPQSVNDAGRLAYLSYEIRYLREARARGVALLGVCLGAQILARTFGARVTKGIAEVGWMPVRLVAEGAASPLFRGAPAEPVVFQWHAETFEVPAGGRLLATSETCPSQAFSLGETVYGLQFHLEITPTMIAAMCAEAPEDLRMTDPPVDPVLLRSTATQRESATRDLARTVFGNFLAIAANRPRPR